MMKSPMNFNRPRGRRGMMYQNGGQVNRNDDWKKKIDPKVGLREIDSLPEGLEMTQFGDIGADFMYKSPDGFKMYGFDDDGLYIVAPDGRVYTGERWRDDGEEVQVTLDNQTYNTTSNFDIIAEQLGAEFSEGYSLLESGARGQMPPKNTRDVLQQLSTYKPYETYQNGGQVDYMDNEGNRQNPPDEQRRPGPTRRDNVMGGGRMGDSGPASAMPVGEGEVMEDEDGRNYVLFENPDDPDGEPVKVYSDNYGWNEVEGKMKKTEDMRSVQIIRMDMDYPIKMNEETGEYELDAGAYEEMLSKRNTDRAESESPFRGSIKREMENPGENPRGAPPVGGLLEQLKQLGSRGQTRKAMGGMRVLKR